MDATERAAIAASLETNELINRVRDVVGSEIGDPLNINADSVALREKFKLTAEHNQAGTVFVFNDETCASVKVHESFTVPHWVRRATCIAVASIWTPAMRAALAAQAKQGGAA